MPEVTDAGDGAPTVLIQNLTAGEFQDQNEIFNSSCISCGETSFQVGIYAIIKLTVVVMHCVACLVIVAPGIQRVIARSSA